MLAGHKCPIKCKWHLQGWTGSVHLSVDESSSRSPLSDQFDVALLRCATSTSIGITERAICGHRPRGPTLRRPPAKERKKKKKKNTQAYCKEMTNKIHKTSAETQNDHKAHKTPTKRCKTSAQTKSDQCVVIKR